MQHSKPPGTVNLCESSILGELHSIANREFGIEIDLKQRNDQILPLPRSKKRSEQEWLEPKLHLSNKIVSLLPVIVVDSVRKSRVSEK